MGGVFGRGFQHLPRDLANVNALKNHVRSLLLHKTENVCYFLRYFLHYIVSPFHRCRANAISTDYAAVLGQGSKHLVTAAILWPRYEHIEFVCVEVLRPSQPNGVMSSAVSLPNHAFTGQA